VRCRPITRRVRRFSKLLVFAAAFLLFGSDRLLSETIRVRVIEGPTHAFLVLQTLDGKTIAEGDLIETLKGATVKTETVLRFWRCRTRNR